MMRKVSFAIVVVLLFASCGGTPEVYEALPGDAAAAGRGADGDLILPAPIPAAPAFSLEAGRAIPEARLERLENVDGVAVVAPVKSKRMRVKGPKGVKTLEVGMIESLRFRAVAPPTMRDADFVWLSLVSGDVVPTFAAVDRLGIKPGDGVTIAGAGVLPVGAWADNGKPNVADLLVDEQHADKLGIGAPRSVLVGAKTGVTLETLRKDLKKVLPGARVRRLVPSSAPPGQAPAPQVVTTSSTSSTAITGLHPALVDAVGRLIAASEGRVWLVSGYRSTAHQQILWQAALERYRDPEVADNWVAPPGFSYHEKGLAVDLGGDVEYAAALAARLKLPLWRPMSWEPWHFELAGSRG
ncbi:MAG TPA: D-alanyl-D-alanine carboxypeptidase family protein [Actinomycetota bacterium]|nr:D-alanyl-D-alanine carboxypeptidase family protein [Actinomycetota bacterium]